MRLIRLIAVWITELLGILRDVRCPACGAVLNRKSPFAKVRVNYHADCGFVRPTESA